VRILNELHSLVLQKYSEMSAYSNTSGAFVLSRRVLNLRTVSMMIMMMMMMMIIIIIINLRTVSVMMMMMMMIIIIIIIITQKTAVLGTSHTIRKVLQCEA